MQTIFDWRRELSHPTNSYPVIQTFPMSLTVHYHDLLFYLWQTPETWLSTFSRRSAAQRHLAALRSILLVIDSPSSLLHRAYQCENGFASSEFGVYDEKRISYDPPPSISSDASSPVNHLEVQRIRTPQVTHLQSLNLTKDPSPLDPDRVPPTSIPFLENISLVKETCTKRPRHRRRRTSKDQKSCSSISSGSDADDEGPISITKRLRTGTTVGSSFNPNSVTWKDGDYISSGTYGDIYKGQLDGCVVCVKLIRPLQIQGDEVKKLTKAFHKEAILWTQLSHRNVLPFYGCRKDFPRPCLVFPWRENGNINVYLLAKPNTNRYQLASDILNGLDYLHSNGVIHGDLKGANVLIDESGRAQIADYGISSLIYSTIEDWGATATTAPTIGTRRWEAPELFGCDGPEVGVKTVKSDVYAWACVCYEIFTGKCPFFEIKTNDAVFFRIMLNRATPTRPSSDSEAWKSSGLVEEFWSVMNVCWSWTPSSRPTIPELLDITLRLALANDAQSTLQSYSEHFHRSGDMASVSTPKIDFERVHGPLDRGESKGMSHGSHPVRNTPSQTHR